LKSHEKLIKIGQRTINYELDAIKGLADHINDDFASAVQLIFDSKGRVIITGIGKSAIIAQKIVATLNSTGTPSIFMHAADAIHGDLGIVLKDDINICISNSGNTPEIKVLVPLIKSRGNKIIAFTGNLDSFLATQADIVLNTGVKKEACPNNLVPTSSTTAQLVMGDALAVTLLECRGFTAEDFARFHPGGMIGKKIYMKVADLSENNLNPKVDSNDSIQKVILEISSKRLGATAVIDNNELIGIVTDGDLRRMLEKGLSIDQFTAKDIMTTNPKTIDVNTLVVDALSLMRKNNITQLLVVDGINYVGVIHLHDILREGIL
jgi:arabinose-5-phosphate isomerase